MSLARVKLAIDKFKEESEEAKLYQDWMKDQADYAADRSLYNTIGKAIGFAVGSFFGAPAAGFLVGGLGGQAAGRAEFGEGMEALDFGGKFDTQGEKEAEFAMQQAEWGKGEELEMGFSSLMQFIQMGGKLSDFGIGGKSTVDVAADVTKDVATDTAATSTQKWWDAFQDPQSWVPEATAMFLTSAHGGFGGDESPDSYSSADTTTDATDTVPTYDDNTTDETVDQEHQEWLASMGITSPLYNNSGTV